MIKKDFVKDIELYICEKFGYRNSVYVNPTCNGCCIDIRNHQENLLDLVKFFKEYAPLYGFHYFGIENDMKGYHRLLGLKPTTSYRFDYDCYAAPLATINVCFLPLFSFYSMIFYTFVNKTKIEGMDKPMNRIKEVLEERGIKQTWLAEKLGKSFCMVNAYVCNRRQPSLEVLFQIADILNVDVKDLINDNK